MAGGKPRRPEIFAQIDYFLSLYFWRIRVNQREEISPFAKKNQAASLTPDYPSPRPRTGCAPMIDLITSVVVDLSEQKLYAYNGDQVVRTILVSSGKAANPTPTFESLVESKHSSVTMRGRGYVAPGVPWALCMPGGMICLHGAPWQEAAGEAFGVPRSHGCVRMPTSQARWLFQRVNPGTPVTVQL